MVKILHDREFEHIPPDVVLPAEFLVNTVGKKIALFSLMGSWAAG